MVVSSSRRKNARSRERTSSREERNIPPDRPNFPVLLGCTTHLGKFGEMNRHGVTSMTNGWLASPTRSVAVETIFSLPHLSVASSSLRYLAGRWWR